MGLGQGRRSGLPQRHDPPSSVLEAIGLVKQGKVYDLGIDYDRTSYKWPGPLAGRDHLLPPPPRGSSASRTWISPPPRSTRRCWPGIAAPVHQRQRGHPDRQPGARHHRKATTGTTASPRPNGAETSASAGRCLHHPAHGGPGDIDRRAGNQGVEALKGGPPSAPKTSRPPWRSQGTQIRPGDAVFVRTGTLRYWGKAGGTIRSWRPTTRPGSTWRPPGGWWKRREPSWWDRTPPCWR